MEGEQEEIGTRIRPIIPESDPEAGREPDTDGWNAIGRVGAWRSMLNEFRMIEEVPEQHKRVWVWGFSEVLKRMEEDEERALMWFCFLPQALLRKAGRGGKAGRGQVARRFNTLAKEDWGGLVEIWERDVEKLGRKEGRQPMEMICTYDSHCGHR